MKTNRLNINEFDRQTIALTILRVVVGWHFLWEGWIKLSQPAWSAKGYLLGTWGPFAPLFQFVAETPWLLALNDFFVPWLLFVSGLGLMLGLYTRYATGTAMVLLAMFIAAMPSFEWAPTLGAVDWQGFDSAIQHAQWAGKQMAGAEGSYFLVNKNVVELLALAVLFTVNPNLLYGIDSLLKPNRSNEATGVTAPEAS